MPGSGKLYMPGHTRTRHHCPCCRTELACARRASKRCTRRVIDSNVVQISSHFSSVFPDASGCLWPAVSIAGAASHDVGRFIGALSCNRWPSGKQVADIGSVCRAVGSTTVCDIWPHAAYGMTPSGGTPPAAVAGKPAGHSCCNSGAESGVSVLWPMTEDSWESPSWAGPCRHCTSVLPVVSEIRASGVGKVLRLPGNCLLPGNGAIAPSIPLWNCCGFSWSSYTHADQGSSAGVA